MWMPEIVRAQPSSPIVLRFLVAGGTPPRQPATAVPAALRLGGVRVVEARSGLWDAVLPWRTLVYGVVRRDVDERLNLRLATDGEGWELRLACLPSETHAAHAAGAGGVAVLAVAAWLAGGWTAGLLPGFATALAGGLWADATRVMSLGRLDLRLRRLLEDVGLALWPDTPADILPPPTRPSL